MAAKSSFCFPSILLPRHWIKMEPRHVQRPWPPLSAKGSFVRIDPAVWMLSADNPNGNFKLYIKIRLRSTRLVIFLKQLWYKERRLLLSVIHLISRHLSISKNMNKEICLVNRLGYQQIPCSLPAQPGCGSAPNVPLHPNWDRCPFHEATYSGPCLAVLWIWKHANKQERHHENTQRCSSQRDPYCQCYSGTKLFFKKYLTSKYRLYLID